MINLLITFLLLSQADVPVVISWDTLANVSFTSQYVERYDANFYVPDFGKDILELEGKTVILTGYMIPLDEKDHVFILSKSNFTHCFFCGVGGPETVAEVQFQANDFSFEMDEIVEVKGTLALNKLDVEHCNYLIKRAEVLKRNLVEVN